MRRDLHNNIDTSAPLGHVPGVTAAKLFSDTYDKARTTIEEAGARQASQIAGGGSIEDSSGVFERMDPSNDPHFAEVSIGYPTGDQTLVVTDRIQLDANFPGPESFRIPYAVRVLSHEDDSELFSLSQEGSLDDYKRGDVNIRLAGLVVETLVIPAFAPLKELSPTVRRQLRKTMGAVAARTDSVTKLIQNTSWDQVSGTVGRVAETSQTQLGRFGRAVANSLSGLRRKS